MEVRVILRNREEKLENVLRVSEVLRRLNLNPETVLVTVEGELVTEDRELKDGDIVTIIDVVSGG